MKGQGKNSQNQINEKELGNIPDKWFRVLIVKVTKKLINKMEKMQEAFNKDLKEMKNKWTMMKSTITNIKITLEEIDSRITEEEEQVSELEDRTGEIATEKQNK